MSRAPALRRLLRVLPALLAMAFLFGQILPAPMAQAAAPVTLGPICHAAGATDNTPSPDHACAQCPLCLLASVPFSLASGPAVAAPRLQPLGRVLLLPSVHAPPAITLAAAWPRGPPTPR